MNVAIKKQPIAKKKWIIRKYYHNFFVRFRRKKKKRWIRHKKFFLWRREWKAFILRFFSYVKKKRNVKVFCGRRWVPYPFMQTGEKSIKRRFLRRFLTLRRAWKSTTPILQRTFIFKNPKKKKKIRQRQTKVFGRLNRGHRRKKFKRYFMLLNRQ